MLTDQCGQSGTPGQVRLLNVQLAVLPSTEKVPNCYINMLYVIQQCPRVLKQK